ncbi:MAG: prepilin-type N-terminal cleavage/methylation domain-containing protein [Lachnospiraceae bacterium]|nr:prepilin-type N-terminal cleavage/methylation domain-containing protein [Lachnospiraceae bacterium]
MIHNKTESNRGYSFVEMLIVLAIMAIMSAMAIVTWNSVNSARYRNAVSTFESEISTLRTATQAQGSEMALKVYYDINYKDRFNKPIGAYVIKRGYCDDSGTFHEINLADTSTVPSEYSHLLNSDYYTYRGVSNPVFVMQKGKIKYASTGTAIATDIGASGVIIRYNKSDGSVKNGDGKFVIEKANGDIAATVNIVKVTGTYFETY